MAARKKLRQACNPCKLWKKVEIPVELQLENANTFLNEFSRSGSVGIESVVDNLVFHDSTKSEVTFPVVKHKHDFKTSRKVMCYRGKVMSDPRSEIQPDQTLTNEKILSQLDAIGKQLSVIESSASVAHPKVKNSACGRTTASSSLLSSSYEGNMHANLPELHTIRHDKLIQEQVEERIRQLSNSD